MMRMFFCSCHVLCVFFFLASLFAWVCRFSQATEIVKDVRKDIDNLRDEMSKKRVWKRNQPDDDNGGVSYSQMK